MAARSSHHLSHVSCEVESAHLDGLHGAPHSVPAKEVVALSTGVPSRAFTRAFAPATVLAPTTPSAPSAAPASDNKPKMHPALFAFIVSTAGLTSLAGLIVMFLVRIQHRLVYKPTSSWKGDPAMYGMPEFDEVTVVTHDRKEIVGWFIKQLDPATPPVGSAASSAADDIDEEARVDTDMAASTASYAESNIDQIEATAPPAHYTSCPTIIYFHGRDKNASFRLKKIAGLFEKSGCNILLLSYRGFGRSTGKPSERGMIIDATSALRYLINRGDVNAKNLWVYGESLGGAVAVKFTTKFQSRINGLILENTFTKLFDMVKVVHPELYIFEGISANKWLTLKLMPSISVPILFMSGQRDSFIPPHMMSRLFESSTQSTYRKIVRFPDGTHNRTWLTKGYYKYIGEFIEQVMTNKIPADRSVEVVHGKSSVVTDNSESEDEDGYPSTGLQPVPA